MADREKVIKGLEEAKEFIRTRSNGSASKICRLMDVCNAAVILLKEQEAVEPILEQDSMVCGVCGHEIIWQKMLGDGIWADEELDYCPHCGKAVKWG